MKNKIVALTAMLLITASFATASETPKMAWVKAKCVICHGEDGAGQTTEGKKRGVPDLRSEAIQKRTDADLAKGIAEGHAKMPSFRVSLDREQINLLVMYIRSVAPKK